MNSYIRTSSTAPKYQRQGMVSVSSIQMGAFFSTLRPGIKLRLKSEFKHKAGEFINRDQFYPREAVVLRIGNKKHSAMGQSEVFLDYEGRIKFSLLGSPSRFLLEDIIQYYEIVK